MQGYAHLLDIPVESFETTGEILARGKAPVFVPDRLTNRGSAEL
jgi:hypothetical protein